MFYSYLACFPELLVKQMNIMLYYGNTKPNSEIKGEWY